MPGAYELIRPHVPTGDKLLWAGQPRQGIVLRWVDAGLIPLSLLASTIPAFGVWQILSESAAYSTATLVVTSTVTLITAAIGLYLLVGRFLADRYYRNSLAYGVTNRRVIIVSEALGSQVTEFPLSSLHNPRLEEKRSGRGTIHLAESETTLMSNGLDIWHPVLGRSPQLFELEEPRKVLGIMRRATR